MGGDADLTRPRPRARALAMMAAMTPLARPPAALSCAELFTTWLPEAFARARAAGAQPPDARLRVELAGDGGGAWLVTVAGGELAIARGGVDAGADADAAIVLRQSVADFRAAIWGEDDHEPLIPPELDLTAAITGQSRVPTAALAQVRGTLAIEIAGFGHRTWSLAVALGGAATPAATVAFDLPTLAALRAGTLPVAQAFFAGKIAVTGDVPWLMQVGMSLAAGGLGGGLGGPGGAPGRGMA